MSGRHPAVLMCVLVAASAPLFGGVDMHLVKGRPVVDGVFVNGHGPYRFLVDTATTSNHIESELARSIGLKPSYRAQLTSLIGMIEVLGISGVEVVLGSARADEQGFLLAGMETVHQISPDIQGVLGQQFLSRFDYLLDVRARRLEFGTLPPGGRRTQVPFRHLNDRPVVSTSLGELAIDSGADSITLFGIGKSDLVRTMVTMSGSSAVGIVSRRLQIEGRTFWRGEAAAIPRAVQSDVAGLLPVSLFRAVYISNSQGYAVFE
jgi:hypothetical protein